MSGASPLEALVAAELSRPQPASAVATTALAEAIRRRFGDGVAAILFYGSCRRTGDMTGLLDAYVLYDHHRRVHPRLLPALFARLLPPNVVQLRIARDGGTLRAKLALMSRRQFARRMRPASLDTTIWTRFCQPASLLYARDPAVERWVATTIAQGIRAACYWAVRLGRPGEGPGGPWRALFAHTYRLEIRPETRDRSGMVYESDAAWFDAILSAVRAESADGDPVARRHWLPRRLAGRPLNLLRLVKAAFTFEGGADYLATKLGRHTGVAPRPGAWQRRHPLLSAPVLLWRHRRAVRRRRRMAGDPG